MAEIIPGYFFDVQNRLKKFVEGGQLGIFRNGYWGHPQYKLPPEANLMGFAHYLEASISSVKLSKSTRSLAVKPASKLDCRWDALRH